MFQNDELKIPPPPEGLFDGLTEAQKAYISFLHAVTQKQRIELQQQETRIQQLEAQLEDLKARLSKNSSNSSKPPSSDGLKKAKKTSSQRRKSGKKPGGQKGHKGSTLNKVADPDHIVTYTPKTCQGCGHDLTKVTSVGTENRQVFDLPEPKVEITEHQAEIKICPCCRKKSKGEFPCHVTAPVQYGTRIQALSAYFANYHFIPFDRLSQIFEDIFEVPLSPGTCCNIDKKLYKHLDVFETNLKIFLLMGKVLHLDETGIRCNKKLYWIHIASSSRATFFGIHAKRGREAIDAFDILPQYGGTVVHDHWSPYLSYTQVKHGLCNSHHLRELIYVHEHKKEEWAELMQKLLIKGKKLVEKHYDRGSLPDNIVVDFEKEYANILDRGFEYHKTLPPLLKSKRGRQKQRTGKNLLDRLKVKQDYVLRYMYDFAVPFTNNQAEQDARMVKVKAKVSGCFRSLNGGEISCRIRSYLSTARKQGWKILDALISAVIGKPKLLSITPE